MERLFFMSQKTPFLVMFCDKSMWRNPRNYVRSKENIWSTKKEDYVKRTDDMIVINYNSKIYKLYCISRDAKVVKSHLLQ